MSLRIISIAVIVLGIIIEVATIGSQVGNAVAAIGIIGFVYDFFKRRQGPRL